jgi:peptide subunit release factor 1 (eRF1)
MGAVKLNPKETSAAHVHAATLAVRVQAEAAAETALVGQVDDGTGTGWAVNGVQDTLKALAAGKVRTLVVNPDAEMAGFRCASGRLAISERECRSEGECVPVPDVIDDAIEEGLRQRVAVEVLHSAAAGRIDGLAGLLRFR